MRRLSTAEEVCKQSASMHAPDGGWGWVVTISSFMVSFLVDGVVYTFGVFFPEFLSYFGESNGKTQLLYSILVGTLFVLGPVVSTLVNKYGCRRVSGSGAVIASVGFFLSSFSPNLDVTIIFYSILGGIGFGLLYFPSIMTLGVYFDKRISFATGLAVCGSGVGIFVFAPLGEFLLETYLWRGSMWIISALVLNAVVFSATFRPLKYNDSNITKTTKADSEHDQYDTVIVMPSNVCCQRCCLTTKAMFDFSLLKSPTMLVYATSCFALVLGLHIPSNFLPAWAIDVNLSTNQGAFLIFFMGVSATVTCALVGYITDKPWANILIIHNTAMLIGGVSTCFVPFCTTFVSLSIYAVVFGAVRAAFICLRSTLMAKLLGVHRLTSSFGLVGLSIGLSVFVGSPIAGALSDMSGNYNMAFYFGGITLVLGSLMCLPLRRISEWEKSRSNDFNFRKMTEKKTEKCEISISQDGVIHIHNIRMTFVCEVFYIHNIGIQIDADRIFNQSNINCHIASTLYFYSFSTRF